MKERNMNECGNPKIPNYTTRQDMFIYCWSAFAAHTTKQTNLFFNLFVVLWAAGAAGAAGMAGAPVCFEWKTKIK